MKKVLAILLTLVMLSGTFTCFAAELNADAVNTHKGQFKNYVLLGDSVASGYRDEVTENDELFNEANQETTYYRVPGSYADVLTKAIIEDNTMTAFAGPGFRTIEIRYMLEDDFDEEDDYMFHPSHLYVVGDPASEEIRTAYKKSVADADLITLGVGGNDWGAYLGWVVSDIMEKEHVSDKYVQMVADLFEGNIIDISTIEKIVEIAHIAGVLPELIQTLPETLEYGLTTFYKNWDIMIEDIYALNPDVTLMVVGMSDNSVKGKYYSYDGVEGEAVPSSLPADNEAIASAVSTVVEFVMTVGNTPMIEGAKKFGYTYVDTKGATYVDSHPDADGHIYIANKIIEALPDPEISTKYDDVKPGHKYYSAIEYVLMNGIMSATSDTTFSPDANLTSGQLNAAFNAINGTSASESSTKDATVIELFTNVFGSSIKKGFMGFFKGLALSYKILADNDFKATDSITRGEAANYIKAFCEI
ncbi:MAG: S-layer homology domain-containing protein [Clostridia bacterium]|nr:S-layer homology domain-containing protein [Clostridia bacterium]